MTLGGKLLSLRNVHQLTQLQISEKLEVSQAAYNKWESDLAKPKMENLLKISEFYQIELEELLENVPNMNFYKAKFSRSSYLINPNEEFLQHLINNQNKIISLIETQNKLIEKLLKS